MSAIGADGQQEHFCRECGAECRPGSPTLLTMAAASDSRGVSLAPSTRTVPVERHRTAKSTEPVVPAVPLVSKHAAVRQLRSTLWDFVHKECIPAEAEFGAFMAALPESQRFRVHEVPVVTRLKRRAKQLGLWNLWMTEEYPQSTAKLTLSEYAPLCEIMGRSSLAPEVR